METKICIKRITRTLQDAVKRQDEEVASLQKMRDQAEADGQHEVAVRFDQEAKGMAFAIINISNAIKFELEQMDKEVA